MDILQAIQWWGKRGIFIEYITIDQIENGYGEDVEKGLIPSVTYTVNVIKDGGCIYDGSFNSLKEALLDGLEYVSKRFSELIPPYGGETTLMKNLNVGTKFHVCNGAWDGEIVLLNGEKHILVDGDTLENASKITDDYTLDIKIR